MEALPTFIQTGYSKKLVIFCRVWNALKYWIRVSLRSVLLTDFNQTPFQSCQRFFFL